MTDNESGLRRPIRRVLSGALGKMVEDGQMPQEIAETLAVKMAYSEPKKFFGL